MEELSLHILDIAENCIRAKATKIEICINEDTKNDLLTIEIKDNGVGMDKETLKKAQDPFYTTKKGKKVGLGIPLFAHAARQSGGDVKIESKSGAGTHIRATFRHSHMDRQPLGDMQSTLSALIQSHPEIHFVFDYKSGKESLHFDTENPPSPPLSKGD